MSANDTEQRLIRLIAEHYMDAGHERLTIQEISARGGITRQAFNKYYKHLTPYVKGALPIGMLVPDPSPELLSKYQDRITVLMNEIANMRRRHVEEVDDVKNSYITSLMNNDLSLMEGDEVRQQLRKQALHADKLVMSNKELQSKLNKAGAAVEKLMRGDSYKSGEYDTIKLSPNLDSAYSVYLQTSDCENLEDRKDVELDKLVKDINRNLSSGGGHVVLFVDRFIACFDRFASLYRTSRNGPVIVARVPVFSRPELQMFSKGIESTATKEIWVPWCSSESVIRAQRQFSFRAVPEIEKEAADRMSFPSLEDGYEAVCLYKVSQGD
ncbi:hypothetical protein [Pseudomonas sp. OIL-1]|uniref:hypothetical protein n=1 Tax=Pseudomonas sp. OIL-1 TaxID=2706126 RepID=UPI0013A734FE|nr:hypothetical protein [Pseudomonas sp. OIL-1]QIB52412.1 hypothetical protein G3M63_16015 [Pseudomonas sp. OIL-1]